MIELKNLEILRGRFKLGPLNTRFEKNGLHLISGANGSGKTSLLKAISGRLRPASGKISLPTVKMCAVGLDPLFFQSWSVERNWNWFSKVLKQQPQQKFREATQSFDDQKISRLSKGMLRRAELSVALAYDFPILLLDEAFDGLDDQNQKFFHDAIERASKNCCVIATSHYLQNFPKVSGVHLSL